MTAESEKVHRLGPVIQHGYVVDNVEHHAAQWVKAVGAGPFYVNDVVLENYRYGGRTADCPLRIAVGYWGNLQIELIQPMDNGDNLYNRVLPAENGKLNHCATHVADLEAVLEAGGLRDRVLQSGHVASGARFVYLEDYLPGGHHLELIQFPEGGQALFPLMAALASQWDGSNPIRPGSALREDLAAFHQS